MLTVRLPHSKRFVDQVMSKFEGYKYQCFGSKEPGWEAYLDLLYPNEWEFQMISNGDLLSHMREQNDDTAQPRAIDHFIILSVARNSNEDKGRWRGAGVYCYD